MSANEGEMRNLVGKIRLQQEQQGIPIDPEAAEASRKEIITGAAHSWLDVILAAGAPGAEIVSYEDQGSMAEGAGWVVGLHYLSTDRYYGRPPEKIFLLADGTFVFAPTGSVSPKKYDLGEKNRDDIKRIEDAIPDRLKEIADAYQVEWVGPA